ncbi:MAG: precorrin-2 dehydrogenase/sirohydrochlorin ferrochelatase family protein [Armatimonadota bacterium]
MTVFYPVFTNLEGKRSVVIGGGDVAERKVFGLLDSGAEVMVISPEVTEPLDALARQGRITIMRRPYRSGDLDGAFLAIAATNSLTTNAGVWREAEERRILINAVDDPAHCNFIAPAIVRQGDLTIAISTGGKSPALAARLRQRLQPLFGPEYAQFLDLLGEVRGELTRRVPDPEQRKAAWYRIVDSDALELIGRGDATGARRHIEEIIGK